MNLLLYSYYNYSSYNTFVHYINTIDCLIDLVVINRVTSYGVYS